MPTTPNESARVQMTCDRCGGSNVTIDATAEWSIASQEWVLSGVLDEGSCEDCKDNCKLKPVEVDSRPIYLTPRERDCLLAALRHLQATEQLSDEIIDIATDGDAHKSLTDEEIDDLCEQIKE